MGHVKDFLARIPAVWQLSLTTVGSLGFLALAGTTTTLNETPILLFIIWLGAFWQSIATIVIALFEMVKEDKKE